MKRGWRPWGLWIWWNARRDGVRNIPDHTARVLSECEREVIEATNGSLERVGQAYRDRMDPIEATRNILDQKVDCDYQKEYDRLVQAAGRRETQVMLGWRAHGILLGLLGAGEGAFNLVAFNALREPGPYTLLMALGIAITVPFLAYVWGGWIRQWPDPWWRTGFLVLGVALAVGFGLHLMNAVRVAYLVEMQPEGEERIRQMAGAFYALNMLIFLGAAAVSYAAHDPVPGFAEAKHRLERARERLARFEGTWDSLANKRASEVEQVKRAGAALVMNYRKLNRHKRKTAPPAYFDDPDDPNHYPQFREQHEPAQFHHGPQTTLRIAEPVRGSAL